MHKLITLCLTLIGLISSAEGATRYKDKIFTKFSKDSNLVYSRAKNYNDSLKDLRLDIYRPQGDTLTAKRPVIIWVYGGFFVRGSKTDNYIIALCEEFAARGYVTVAMDYRLGYKNAFSLQDQYDAMYRAIQDVRAATAWVRKNASAYGMDSDKVVVGGLSAGSIASMQAAWLRSDKELPLLANTSKYGGIDATSMYPSVKPTLKALINFFGAIPDTTIPRKGSTPVIHLHGTADTIVPYKLQPIGFGYNFYGSYYIHEAAVRHGLYSELHPFVGAGHGYIVDTAKYDTSVAYIRDFLYKTVIDESLLAVGEAQEPSVHSGYHLYYAPTDERIVIQQPGQGASGALMLQICDMQGRLLNQYPAAGSGSVMSFPVGDLRAGMYIARLQSATGSASVLKFVR